MKKESKKIISVLHVLAIIAIPCFLAACNKEWLDVKADKKQAIPQTIQDLQSILDEVTTMNLSSASSLVINEYAADGHYYTDAAFQRLSTNGNAQNAYTWSRINSIDRNIIRIPVYQNAYASIANCNVILDAKLGENNKDDFDHIRAQALFHRARTYYNLAQTFAPPYKAASANTDLGLALRLNTDITEKSRRASVRETYNQIINDLKSSLDHLPIVPKAVTRSSKPAVFGLLSRVYFTMSDYENAFLNANEYLKLKTQLLDYNTVSPLTVPIGVNLEVTFMEFLSAGSALTSNYLIDPHFYDSYDDNDLRKTLFFNVSPNGITFNGHYSLDISNIFTGIATDEIYLIRAECYARKGDFVNAMKDLNELLRHRWKKNPNGSTTYVNQTADNEVTALMKIFVERKKELILRGLRWTDLRRLNQDDRFKITLSRTVVGKQYTLEPGSPRYTFPFPQEVIDETGMQQNPGWN